MELDKTYVNPNDIYREASLDLKRVVQVKADNPDKHYRFYIYKEFNPQLLPSPFLACSNGADAITRFRLGSHNLYLWV